MSMKKQPEGVRRVARVKDEKPPQSYDLYLGKGKDEAYLGWSERLPNGYWQVHLPAEDGTVVPPFKQHTALVEFALGVHRGLEVHPGTQDVSAAEETEAILADPQTPGMALTPGEEVRIWDPNAETAAEFTSGMSLTPAEAKQVEEALADETPLAEWERDLLEGKLHLRIEGLVTPGVDITPHDPGTFEYDMRGGDTPFQPEGTPEGPSPETPLPDPDGVPFSHAEQPEPWEYEKSEPSDKVTPPSFDDLFKDFKHEK
jgi:hypothetical protein